jgi:hypothetical protein
MPELDAAEDELAEALEKAGAAYFGRVTETSSGRMYLVTADALTAHGIARSWANPHRAWSARAEVKTDPSWEFRRSIFVSTPEPAGPTPLGRWCGLDRRG